MTPGTREKHDLAGALDLRTGTLRYHLGPRKTSRLFLDLLQVLDDSYPATPFQRLYIVVDNFKTHKVKAVAHWVATHPRVTLFLLSTYYLRGSPIERAFGDMHDCCTRNHRRKRLRNWSLM